MTTNDFNKAVNTELEYCKVLLLNKGIEYAPDAVFTRPGEEAGADRLASFKKAAALMGVTNKEALLGMFVKHIVSVYDMCAQDDEYLFALWREKITDCINYLLLLYAMVCEEKEVDNG